MRRHINEFTKTSLANSGRAAGMGMLYDRYGDESILDDHIRTGYSVGITEREEKAKEEHENAPVKTYYIEVTK